MPKIDRFRLDDEQRNWLQDCLRMASADLAEPFEEFVDRIEASVEAFHRADPDGTFREAHDALRELWRLSHDPDPGIGQLRARLRKLPTRALGYMDDRARILIPRLFPGDVCHNGFIAWADDAAREKVVRAIQVLSAEGGGLVPGRGRPRGKRSAAHSEPVVLGQARGAAGEKPKGGRPAAQARHTLVMYLALDWYVATNTMPQPGRSDRTGFGQLVHCLFDWLHEPGAERALRDYWRRVKEGQQPQN